MQATNFCFPETHSESQGAPLNMSRMMHSPSRHHNGTCKMHDGLGGRGCVCVGVGLSVCVHCGIRLFANRVSSF